MTTIFRTAAIVGLFSLAACSQTAEETVEPVTNGVWTIDSKASELSYVTVKSGEIVEVNSFENVSGSVGADGAATLSIDLASVSTGIDIRDERMRDIFFEVAANPTATVTAQIDPAAFEALGVGESTTQTLEATLSVKGVEAPVEAEIDVTRVAADRVIAVSASPVVVYADALELTGGLAQLQELAGLPSITPAVPVTFSLAFER